MALESSIRHLRSMCETANKRIDSLNIENEELKGLLDQRTKNAEDNLTRVQADANRATNAAEEERRRQQATIESYRMAQVGLEQHIRMLAGQNESKTARIRCIEKDLVRSHELRTKYYCIIERAIAELEKADESCPT
jgi:chromosome segregation ATPase